MREILFKAKRKDNGEYAEGHYCKIDETTYCVEEDYKRFPVPTHHYILHETMTDWGLPNRFLQFEIDPNTLCQYTGLTDKNGQKIWENDVILITSDKYGYSNGVGNIEFYEGLWYVDGNIQDSLYDLHRNVEVEVVGNIFDNPELLEVE